MKKFSTVIKENNNNIMNESIDTINIDNNWLDQAKEEDLSRIAICVNINNKQRVYTYNDILKSLSGENLNNIKAAQIIEKFFNKLGIDKDGAYSIYFDAGHYKIIKWK